jgi:hypothetical protein
VALRPRLLDGVVPGEQSSSEEGVFRHLVNSLASTLSACRLPT